MSARWSTGVVAALLLSPACNASIEPFDPRPQGGSPGLGAALGGSGSGGRMLGSAGNRSGGSAGNPMPEARTTNRLTLLHGLVDAARVRICVRASGEDDAQRILEPPGNRELGFGSALIFSELPNFDPARDDLEFVLIAGELQSAEQMSCGEAIDRARLEQEAKTDVRDREDGAGGALEQPTSGGSGSRGDPRLRLGELPVIPAGTLASGRSWLLVGYGCIGGELDADRAPLACGSGFRLDRPNLGAVLVSMSRLGSPGNLGLQVVHASAATGEVSVRTLPPPSRSDPPIAVAKVSLGQIAPGAARADHSRVVWGAGLADWGLEVVQGTSRVHSETWQRILDLGGIEQVEDGKNYTIVLIGPRLGSSTSDAWNPSTITIVRSDPE